jgi:hypothetical protein
LEALFNLLGSGYKSLVQAGDCIWFRTKSIETGTIPKDWKHTNFTPAFKKGERYKAENYIPISLTCIYCKLMEHIITSNIMKHLDSNNILYDLQHGFRKARLWSTPIDLCSVHYTTAPHSITVLLDREECRRLLPVGYLLFYDPPRI